MKAFICIACVTLVLAVLAMVECQEALPGPPARPSVFRNPHELRTYLKKLNEYFAIVGRPRFGRSVQKRSLSAFRRAFGGSLSEPIETEGDSLITPEELEYYNLWL